MVSIEYWGVWLKRFRKRCGYGVHSPFAFNFITGVVYEKGSYYAYAALDKKYFPGVFQRFSYSRKRAHFLFRLANYLQPDLILSAGDTSVADMAYMTAGCLKAEWRRLEYDSVSLTDRRVLMYLDTSNANSTCISLDLLHEMGPHSALLFRFHSNEERKECVERFKMDPSCGVTFDLYDYLLVFFDKKYYKQHYVVNFFD